MENPTVNPDRNPERDLAFSFLSDTDVNVFLTGKAGTGKTTFLRSLSERLLKEYIVTAPTGVAAINAGGVTLHSLFQLPFSAVVVDWNTIWKLTAHERMEAIGVKQLRKDKRRLLQRIELLVIDEVSMLRADYLDAIDIVLRSVRGNWTPFGGVQLLLIGDLYQLPPVVRDDEWAMLSRIYDTPFFFSSRGLADCGYVSVELQKVYRQSDRTFLSLLNAVREGEVDEQVIRALNARYPGHEVAPERGRIVLTTHNAQADRINRNALERLDSKPYRFTAIVDGDFGEKLYPTEVELTLKLGAQVMFIRNDRQEIKRYYNGKIGEVTKLDEQTIEVTFPEGRSVSVERDKWENIRYQLDETTQRVEQEILGTFTQYPLRLAWAITIHKSQGLTFDEVMIDGANAFASGQVYVALSRCRTLEGIVLSSPLDNRTVMTDMRVVAHNRGCQAQRPTPEYLRNARLHYERKLLLGLFDYSRECSLARQILYDVEQDALACSDAHRERIAQITPAIVDIDGVMQRFSEQLSTLLMHCLPLAEHSQLQERVIKAVEYVLNLWDDGLLELVQQMHVDSEHKRLFSQLEELQQLAVEKWQCSKACVVGFSVERYSTARVLARMEREKGGDRALSFVTNISDFTLLRLEKWRSERALQDVVKPGQIMGRALMYNLAEQRPTTPMDLLAVPGVSDAFVEKYGRELRDIFESADADFRYAQEQRKAKRGAGGRSQSGGDKAPPTLEQTRSLIKSGLSFRKICERRSLKPSMIEGHVTKLLESEQVSIREVLPARAIQRIEKDYESYPDDGLKERFERFGGKYSYAQLRWVGISLSLR